MGQDKKAPKGRAEVPAAQAKKPYVKPVVRRIGSVRELTLTTPSNGK